MRTLRAGYYQPLLLLLTSSAFALLFLNAKGTDDIQVWQRWATETEQHGLVLGYARSEPNYPPLTFVILTTAVKGAHALGLSDRTGIKLSLLALLLLTTAVFAFYTRNLLLATGLQLALILCSVDLAYLEVYATPFLIGALWALQRRRWGWFTLLFAVTCLIKWQSLIFAPFIALYILDIRTLKDLRTVPWRPIVLQVIAPVVILAGALLAIFGQALLDALNQALTYPFLSAQALNLNWLITFLLHVFDPATYGPLDNGLIHFVQPVDPLITLVPRLLFWAVYGFLAWRFFRAPKSFANLLLYAVLGYLAYFTLNTGVHENHLFPAVVLAAVLAHLTPPELPLFLTWTLVANINLFVFYGIDGRILPFNRVIWAFDSSLPLALLNVLLFIALLWRVTRPKNSDQRAAEGDEQNTPAFSALLTSNQAPDP